MNFKRNKGCHGPFRDSTYDSTADSVYILKAAVMLDWEEILYLIHSRIAVLRFFGCHSRTITTPLIHNVTVQP